MSSLEAKIDNYCTVGRIDVKKVHKLGIETIKDLLMYLPFRYEDLSNNIPIDDLEVGQTATVRGRVDLISTRRSKRRRMYVTEALISDDSGSIKVVWFNQPFMSKVLQVGDFVFLSGKVDNDYVNFQFTNPAYEKVSRNRKRGTTIHTGRIVPVYPLTTGISQRQIRLLMEKALPYSMLFDDWIPTDIKRRYHLIDLDKAVKSIHFPDSEEDLQSARYRLQFDELLLIQLYSQKIRQEMKRRESISFDFYEKETRAFVQSLGYTLTNAQKKSAWEIITDITEGEGPMNRLLEGDVGSGKTIVAALVSLNVILNKSQAILMAPTEILAKQHYETMCALFSGHDMNIGLLTRTQQQWYEASLNENIDSNKKELLEKIEKGDLDLIIGTHSLLAKEVSFDSLGLIIVDEQHRFGVKQRQQISQRNKSFNIWPHFLSMTATPIPRTMALALYGDLDISIIDEMPPGRKPVITRVIDNHNRAASYDFIKEHIKQGRQCFIICPLINESDTLGVKSVKEEYERLSGGIFSGYRLGMLHGKLKKDEKDEVMSSFVKNETHILIATSVVEVGVNVPNATIMIIEGADRFGLAQLHQFRGRVGRADHQSYCFVFTETDNNQTLNRLEKFAQSTNGFELAEYDLQMRGAGEVFGTKQSGMVDLKIANLSDAELIKKTRDAAREILLDTSGDENLIVLKKKLEDFEKIHFLE